MAIDDVSPSSINDEKKARGGVVSERQGKVGHKRRQREGNSLIELLLDTRHAFEVSLSGGSFKRRVLGLVLTS